MENHKKELAKVKEKHQNDLAQEKSFVNGIEVHLESLNQYLSNNRKPQIELRQPTSPEATAEQVRVTA